MRNIAAAAVLCALFLSLGMWADDRSTPPVPAAGNVSIPLDEYNELVELASRAARKSEAPPLPYVLTRADFNLTAANGAVRGKVQMEGEVLNKGLTKVPLAEGLTVFDAQRDGKPLPLMQQDGMHVGILPGQGTFNVTLDAGLPVAIAAGHASFRLPVPASGTASLTLTVPGDRTNVKVQPGLITNQTSENGLTTVEAILRPGQAAEVSWATREVATPTAPRELRFLSDVKTLLTVSEGELSVAALADVTVLQGDPAQFDIELPAGYEFIGATGGSIDSTEENGNVLAVKVLNPAQRNHQFLISLEKALNDAKADAPFLTFHGAQRETGEMLVEGTGTIQLNATEGGGLKRIDLKETNPALRSMARNSVQAAFRYHRQPSETPTLALEWTRFPDSSVLAAVVDRAVVTTLVTTEGKSLTEVKLLVRNRAQPFLKLALPPGASILSAEVAGERVKPVSGADGARVPLLRAGLRPVDAYTVNFVYLHSGAPFAKQGGAEIALPSMDVPIGLLQWEVFLPEQYKVKEFGGDALAANQLLPGMVNFVAEEDLSATANGRVGGFVAGGFISAPAGPLLPGQLGGYVVDPSGAVVSGVHVTVQSTDTGARQEAMTDTTGRWIVQNLSSGQCRVTADSPGFQRYVQNIYYDASRPVGLSFKLNLGAVTQTVQVTSGTEMNRESQRIEREAKKNAEQQQMAASANVTNFQQRVAGVLPIRVDVPHTGNSYRFFRPLVLDEETKVTFTYKTK
jgi:hypothetical protein